MVAQFTGVIGVVRLRVYGVTGVVGEPLEVLACFRVVGWSMLIWLTPKIGSQVGVSSWGCASLSAAHGGHGTVRTMTVTCSMLSHLCMELLPKLVSQARCETSDIF
jgi:hypothetical protein